MSSPDGGYTNADTLYVENHCVEQDVACTLELVDECGFDGGGGYLNFKWDATGGEIGVGVRDGDWDELSFDICGDLSASPSATPTISSSPTTSPSHVPSITPTDTQLPSFSPSHFPSFLPTLSGAPSLQPSTSMEPSVSLQPSNSALCHYTSPGQYFPGDNGSLYYRLELGDGGAPLARSGTSVTFTLYYRPDLIVSTNGPIDLILGNDLDNILGSITGPRRYAGRCDNTGTYLEYVVTVAAEVFNDYVSNYAVTDGTSGQTYLDVDMDGSRGYDQYFRNCFAPDGYLDIVYDGQTGCNNDVANILDCDGDCV